MRFYFQKQKSTSIFFLCNNSNSSISYTTSTIQIKIKLESEKIDPLMQIKGKRQQYKGDNDASTFQDFINKCSYTV